MSDQTPALILEELVRKGKGLLLARSTFNRAWLNYWVNHLHPCQERTFYRLLSVFRTLLETFVFTYKRGHVGVTNASQELFRQVCTGEAFWDWDEAMGFVKFYEQLHNQLGASIAHLYEFHGDGFSDLCDNLPLAGETLVRRCLASHPRSSRPRREGFLDANELTEAVNSLGPPWDKFILSGENYVTSNLESACKQYWLHELLVDRTGRHGWSADEQAALSYACDWES